MVRAVVVASKLTQDSPETIGNQAASFGTSRQVAKRKGHRWLSAQPCGRAAAQVFFYHSGSRNKYDDVLLVGTRLCCQVPFTDCKVPNFNSNYIFVGNIRLRTYLPSSLYKLQLLFESLIALEKSLWNSLVFYCQFYFEISETSYTRQPQFVPSIIK